jgi:LysR family transcriptional activator of nhaA
MRSSLPSPWLNYHHLLYFWTVAREGSIAAAGKRLRLAHATISMQIKTLEDQLGVELFDRSGRKLELTEMGQLVFGYADNIFSLGRELVDVLQDGASANPRLRIGIHTAVPKLVAYRLIEPALRLGEGLQVICYEDRFSQLLTRLAGHELDLVISDSPLGPDSNVEAFSHLLGQSSVSFFAAPHLAEQLRSDFPRSLDRARFLLPLPGSMIRRELGRWFEAEDLQPEIVGQFEGSALLTVFGQSGLGAFAGPSVIEAELEQQYGVHAIGRTDAIHERFYAITADRRIRHPGVVAISQSAKATMFSDHESAAARAAWSEARLSG